MSLARQEPQRERWNVMKKYDIFRLIIGFLTLVVIFAGIFYSINISHIAISLSVSRENDTSETLAQSPHKPLTHVRTENNIRIEEFDTGIPDRRYTIGDTNDWRSAITSVYETSIGIRYTGGITSTYISDETRELSLFECFLYPLMIILPILNGVLFVITHKNRKHIEK